MRASVCNSSPAVIAFGAAITQPDVYRALRRARASAARPSPTARSSPRFRRLDVRGLQRDARRAPPPLDDLEALVLAAPGHRDRRRGRLREGARRAARPRGRRRRLRRRDGRAQHRVVGGLGRRCASFVHRYEELGGGDVPAFSWAWADAPPYARTGEVDTLDGFLLVLSPWAVRELRFDESLGQLARLRPRLLPAGARRRAARSSRATSAPSTSTRSTVQRARGLDRGAHARRREVGRAHAGRRSGAGSWRERALRAEAERDAARLRRSRKRLRRRRADAGSSSARWRRGRAACPGASPRRCAGWAAR